MQVVTLEPRRSEGCFCRCCGGELYLYELCYLLDGGPVCEDCLPEYAREYFRDRLVPVADYLGVAP